MIRKFIKKQKLLFILLMITLIALVFGILFISILSNSNQDLIKTSINAYFNGISSGENSYLSELYSSLTSNLVLGAFVWIIGISIIGVAVVILVLLFKSFLVGFSFTSIIYTYGFKGIVPGVIYIIPEIINLFVLFLLTYYSISFSLFLFNFLFRKREFNKRVIVSRYLKLLIVCCVLFIFSSLVSTFVVPNILKMF